MIDKKISIGSLITVLTLVGTFIYTQGQFSTKFDNIDSTIVNEKAERVKTVKRIKANEDQIVDLKIGQAKIQTQIDEGFKRLEQLLLDQ